MNDVTRTLVVWCPDWPVVAADLRGTPAAVVFANRVVACSAPARAEGVRRGQRRREAQARCPDMVIVERDDGRDARAFEPVVTAVEAFAPRVEVTRPGLCAVPTRGPSRYFGGDDALAERVVAAVRGAIDPAAGPIDCRVGVADGPFAAVLAARTGVSTSIVPPGESATFLAPFPVGALEMPDLADLLRRLGIRSLGAFASIPAADVIARFGPEGARAHRLACGLDERPLATRTPPPDLAVAIELDPPVERADAAAFAARTLAHQLHADLASRGLACTRIIIEAETEHGERRVRRWRHDGALTPAMIAERVRWQIDGWLHDDAPIGGITAGVALVRLTPDEVRPDDGRQSGFWGGAAEADDRVGRALTRVQGMLGPDAVTTAVLVGGRGPAEQIRLIPWGDSRELSESRVTAKEVPAWPGRVPAPAPATVPARPAPATVVDAAGRPVEVSGRGFLTAAPARLDGVPIIGWAGPWPADERWWDPATHRRRARFQMQTGDGAAYLVSREANQWWIEATYD